jgi:6-pyruvoyltetrahydropterin/6-carboxytetrahydropterin synthase
LIPVSRLFLITNQKERNDEMEILVVKKFRFEAAHFLPGYEGDCAQLHGHSYELHIGIKGNINPTHKTGMVVDFKNLKKIVHACVISKVDHKCLNDLNQFTFSKNPTAENIVRQIVTILKDEFNGSSLSFVRLYETADSYAEWREE